jgi:hypothetical protein
MGVTVVMLLTFLVGIFDLFTAVLLLVRRDDAATQASTGLSGSAILTLAIVQILIAIFIILLASAIGRGNSGARMILSFVLVARLLLGLWGTVAIHGNQRWSSLTQAIVSAVLLLLLFTADANTFFRAKKF